MIPWTNSAIKRMACFRISISMDLKSTMLHTRCTKNPDIVCFHLYEISKVEKWEDGRLIGCLYSVRDVTANIFRFLLEWWKFQSWLWEEYMPANILKSIRCTLNDWLIWLVNYFSIDNCYCWVIGGFLKYIFCTIPLNYL